MNVIFVRHCISKENQNIFIGLDKGEINDFYFLYT